MARKLSNRRKVSKKSSKRAKKPVKKSAKKSAKKSVKKSSKRAKKPVKKSAKKVSKKQVPKVPEQCIDSSHLKKYRTRPSPPFPANNCRNEIMTGNDGILYISKRKSNGVFHWVEY